MKIQTYKDEVEEVQKKMVELVKSILNFEFTELFIHCVNEEDISGFNFFVEKDKNLVMDTMLGIDPNVLNNIKTQGLSLIKEIETISKKHTKEIPTIMEVLYFSSNEEVIPLNYRYDKICHERAKSPETLCAELLEKYKKEYSNITYIQKNDGMVIMKKGVFCYRLEEGKWVHDQGLFSNFNGGYNDWKNIDEQEALRIMEDMKIHPEAYKKANNDISGINAKKVLIAVLIVAVILLVIYYVKKPKEDVNNTNNTNIEEKGFYSVLDHLPEFKEISGDESVILWDNSIPLNANPFDYANDMNKVYLKINNKNSSLTAEEIKALHVKDSNKQMTLEFGSLWFETKNNKKLHYTPFNNITYEYAKWNNDYLKENDLSYEEMFQQKMYVSDSSIYNMDGIPKEGSLSLKMNFLYNYFGQPSGIYWYNSTKTLTNNIDVYKTFEEFVAAPKGDTDHGSKSYAIVWNYDNFSVVLYCYDDERVNTSGTSFERLVLMPKTDNKELYPVVPDVLKVVDGYYGLGEKPAFIK